jgi:hypothetical protein
VVNYFGDKASVNITEGKLDLKVTGIASGEQGWWGIRKRSNVDLKNKAVEINLDFQVTTDGGPDFYVGVMFLNMPFTEMLDPQFRGIFAGVAGSGRGDASIFLHRYKGGGHYEPLQVPPSRFPCTLKIKVSEQAVYVAEVVNGTEKLLLSRLIDFAPVNLYFYIITRALYHLAISIVTASVYVDYVEIRDEKVTETAGELIVKEFTSTLLPFLYTFAPLALVMLTLTELRRAFKEVK